MEEAPCGCKFGPVGNVYVFEPCALDCDLYAWFQREAASQGKPVTTIDTR